MPSTAPEQKMVGYGTQLHVSDNGSAYTQIFDVELVTPPDLSRDPAEVTVLDSPSFAKEHIAAWIDLGKMPFNALYASAGANYTLLQGYFFDGITRWWKVKLPLLSGQITAAQFVVKGFLTKAKLSEAKAAANDPFAIECEICIATATAFAFTGAS